MLTSLCNPRKDASLTHFMLNWRFFRPFKISRMKEIVKTSTEFSFFCGKNPRKVKQNICEILNPSELEIWFESGKRFQLPSFSWSIWIISQLIIGITATYNSSKMYLNLYNVGIYSYSFTGYDLNHKKRQNNALITWF